MLGFRASGSNSESYDGPSFPSELKESLQKMPTDRIPSTFNETDVISERMYLNTVLKDPEKFPQVKSIRKANIRNDCDPKKVGAFKSTDDMRSVTKHARLLRV